MPLVGNSFLVNAAGEQLQGIGDMLAIGAHTVGRALTLHKLLIEHDTDSAWDHGPWRALKFPDSNHWRDRSVALARVNQVLSYVPLPWQQAALTCLQLDKWPFISHHSIHSVGDEFEQAAATLRDLLGWPHARTPNSVMPVQMLTVSHACAMLMRPIEERRVARWKEFLAEVYGQHGMSADGDVVRVSQLLKLFKHLWKLGWHNQRKVVFWRLCVNGLPFSDRFHTGKSCVCTNNGADCPGRLHHFWHCDAAQAVIGEMQRGMQCSTALQRRHVWLMEVPEEVEERFNNSDAVRQAWRVVCLAAVEAMWQTSCHVMMVAPADSARHRARLQEGGGEALRAVLCHQILGDVGGVC
jgi:hypothetical protein